MMRTLTLRNNLFNDFLTDWNDAFFSEDYSYWRRNHKQINSTELDNSFEYYVPLPGFKKKDIKATINDGVVSLLAERDGSTASYSFSLPERVDISTLSAKHEDGLLTISVEKEEKVKPKSIKID